MHCLIIGQTESGKSMLSKMIVRDLHAKKKKVAVLDPLLDSDWGTNAIFDDPADFVAYLSKERSVYFFVDESGEVFNEGRDHTYNWLATRSRHFGHCGHFIAQRGIQIPTTMRFQCRRVFLFNTSLDDAKLLSAEWNKPQIQNAHLLPQFEFYMADRFEVCNHLRINPDKREIENVNSRPNNSRRVSSRRRNNDSGNGAVDTTKGNGVCEPSE